MLLTKLPKMLAALHLKRLQYESGLFGAANCARTGYNKAWLRDNIYEAIGLERIGDIKGLTKTFNALFDVLIKHEYKIDWAIEEKPNMPWKYIHPRYHPVTFDEFHENWGNKQNDTIGAFLFKVGDLHKKGIDVFRGTNDLMILQKLVWYLASIEYWHDADNGIWEENEEVHSSSVGACVAGLVAVKGLVDVPDWLIEKGRKTLDIMLPWESSTKEVDLALLSLIYPYDVCTTEQKMAILKNVEEKLVRKKGVIRYVGDNYYFKDGEAEWTFGLPWLAIIYRNMGDMKKYKSYMKKSAKTMNWKRELPELYFSGTDKHNDNVPLGWAQAMYLVALK